MLHFFGLHHRFTDRIRTFAVFWFLSRVIIHFPAPGILSIVSLATASFIAMSSPGMCAPHEPIWPIEVFK
ncbi:hypothetical protein P152DRAFT_457407 [Eremomyces bilateralis CBS 781.70]|uniref:Uncharacterized protein n=1 Tax=Eremomyces bilateralis CBS 781.70 TaxID=1392243 RepID=A0A6G1G7Y2_9PEZI|nr:uncharacterized protein P152DRAFT_457407 [Eremomyces bilateralis CBS 781.70]KAF1814046.1 hypothetical protein P152DRAFT_457407 [Eremomyces bilateralis CBS 781.70]